MKVLITATALGERSRCIASGFRLFPGVEAGLRNLLNKHRLELVVVQPDPGGIYQAIADELARRLPDPKVRVRHMSCLDELAVVCVAGDSDVLVCCDPVGTIPGVDVIKPKRLEHGWFDDRACIPIQISNLVAA